MSSVAPKQYLITVWRTRFAICQRKLIGTPLFAQLKVDRHAFKAQNAVRRWEEKQNTRARARELTQYKGENHYLLWANVWHELSALLLVPQT